MKKEERTKNEEQGKKNEQQRINNKGQNDTEQSMKIEE